MIEQLYPRPTGTFYQREIDGLAENGIEIHTFVLRPYEAAAWADPAVLALTGGVPPDRSRVHYGAFFFSASVWRANLRALVWKPRRYLGTLAALVRNLSRKPRVSLKMLALFPKAVYFAAEADRLGIDHLCAFWASYCATAAFVMTRLMDRAVTFSTYAHAGGDLYKDQTFLREKLRAAAAIFTVCEFNRQWLVERYPEAAPKILVHHLGLDLAQYPFDSRVDSSPRPGDALGAVAGSERTDGTILAVGALDPAKGFHILIEACARLRARGITVRCEILGEGPERADLEARARRLGLEEWVSLPGLQAHPEVVRRMRAARLLVHPSVGLGDAVPTVIKEATAVGTPVVASWVVGIPELVVDGETGLLVPPNDPEALAGAISRMLDDPAFAARLATAGRARAERMFDLHQNSRRLAEELRRLVSPGLEAGTRGVQCGSRAPACGAPGDMSPGAWRVRE
jgi:glycosyltransferase involved in cell wall biosynthesis